MPDFYEFFAGGGMARAGLGPGWKCLFANDFDPKKCGVYRQNWGDGELRTLDVGSLTPGDLPGNPDLVWASFPCQDLSLAGEGAGLGGKRSGTFWPFWRLMKARIAEQRAPAMIVLENVCGTLTSHEGRDFAAICSALSDGGYSIGALVVDAALFVPQSRPRLFIVCVRQNDTLPRACISNSPVLPWHTRAVRTAYAGLPHDVRGAWIWWNPAVPPARESTLAEVIEDDPPDVRWFSEGETAALISKMSDVNREKLDRARHEGKRVVGGVYKRTRQDETGRKVQRAEIRFDDVSGCLRTPAGGSSRQIVVIVEGASVKARLISARETARLMGLPDTYTLPRNYNEGYHLTGDGVVVPVVRHLARCIFEPVIRSLKARATIAA